MAARGALRFLPLITFLVAAAASFIVGANKTPADQHLLKICTENLETEELMNFCAYDLLESKASEFVDNDWQRMSAAALSMAVVKAKRLQDSVSNLSRIKTLPGMSRAMVNLCLPGVQKAAELVTEADKEFQAMKEVSDEDIKKIQILVDNVKVNTGTCNDVLVGKTDLVRVKDEVYQAYMSSLIVTEFLSHVTC